MEAMFKIKAKELDKNWLDSIKQLFQDKEIVIKVSTDMDETDYLSLYPANKEHILKNMAAEPSKRFRGNEFDDYVKENQ